MAGDPDKRHVQVLLICTNGQVTVFFAHNFQRRSLIAGQRAFTGGTRNTPAVNCHERVGPPEPHRLLIAFDGLFNGNCSEVRG